MVTSRIVAFQEPDQYAACARGARLQLFVTARGQYRADVTRINFDQLWLQQAQHSLPFIARASGDGSRQVIIFYEGGQPFMQHMGTEVMPGDLIVGAYSSEQYLRTTKKCQSGSVSITSGALTEACITLAGCELKSRHKTRIVRPAAPVAARFTALHKAAANLAITAPEVLRHAHVAKALEDGLVEALVRCLTGSDADREAGRSVLSSTVVMQRFEQILEERAGEPLYLLEICKSINVTDRTLRAHCQDHLGMSPHRYLWLRRMHLARRMLTTADRSNTTVANIANDCGFGELGRFAVAYRSLFNESPSMTLRREPAGLKWSPGRPSELESGFA